MIRSTSLSALVLAITIGPVAAQGGTPGTGELLYRENCASCHGADLEGQPDWRSRLPSGRLPAPPHDGSGHTWHHPDRALFDIVKRGPAAIVGDGYESDMPGFDGTLTDAEITAILDYIKSTWPERMRVLQEGRTRADQEARP